MDQELIRERGCGEVQQQSYKWYRLSMSGLRARTPRNGMSCSVRLILQQFQDIHAGLITRTHRQNTFTNAFAAALAAASDQYGFAGEIQGVVHIVLLQLTAVAPGLWWFD